MTTIPSNIPKLFRGQTFSMDDVFIAKSKVIGRTTRDILFSDGRIHLAKGVELEVVPITIRDIPVYSWAGDKNGPVMFEAETILIVGIPSVGPFDKPLNHAQRTSP